jgi:hypothetical protein
MPRASLRAGVGAVLLSLALTLFVSSCSHWPGGGTPSLTVTTQGQGTVRRSGGTDYYAGTIVTLTASP